MTDGWVIAFIALAVVVVILFLWNCVITANINQLWRADTKQEYEISDAQRDVKDVQRDLRDIVDRWEVIDKSEIDHDTQEAINELMETVKELAG